MRDRIQFSPYGLQTRQALIGLPHHGRHLVEHRKNLVHTALIEDGDLHACFDEQRRDVGLQVRKTKNTIRLERQNLVDLGAQECTDLGLFFTGPARTHRVAADAHNARLLTEEIKPLRGLFGQADDALGQ